MDILAQFKKARAVGVPLVGIETPDPAATVTMLLPTLTKSPAFQWDIVRGMRPMNQAAEQALIVMFPEETERNQLRAFTGNPAECLDVATRLPKNSVLFYHNAHRYLDNEVPSQAAWNLRDLFKMDGRTLVLMAPALRLSPELERDVIVLDEALPDDKTRGEIIQKIMAAGGVAKLDAGQLGKAVEASRGLGAFQTEQSAALALEKSGLDLAGLWERKRKTIEGTRGLSMVRTLETFDNIGGLDNIKGFGKGIFQGNAAPTCVVFLDEIEKMFAGASSGADTSGVSQDFLGVVLRSMEDNEWTGQICVGPPGCAKSAYSKALGNTHNVPVIALDLGAIKGSLVGQSETQMRSCIKTILAVAGTGAFFVATCNKLDNLPPELRRRFRLGIWYFDLPDKAERDSIWPLALKHYEITGRRAEKPDDTDWTGADIRNCAEVAWRLNSSLVTASSFITPVAKSDPDSIKKLRAMAHGRFLSASKPGFYQMEAASKEANGSRSIKLDK